MCIRDRTSPEVVHQRMIDRNSDRDTWKLTHWDEYIKQCNFGLQIGYKRIVAHFLSERRVNEYDICLLYTSKPKTCRIAVVGAERSIQLSYDRLCMKSVVLTYFNFVK